MSQIDAMTLHIQKENNPRPEEEQWLRNGIMRNAQKIKGHEAVEFFSFFLRDAQGGLHGGLNGDILYGGMYISQLFIEENLRLMGYGSQLMQKAEALAQIKQCHFISVNTMDFEALDFYKKLGFYIEFSRHGYKKQSVFHFLRKQLRPADAIQTQTHFSTVDKIADMKELMLSGGGRTKVARILDDVHRETGVWSDSVHALLQHLEQHGFAGAPRVKAPGYDAQGREVLSYLDGQMIHPELYSPEAMAALGALLRHFHQISAHFTPPPQAHWQAWFCRDIGTPDIIGHGDVAPWNIITQQNKPTALIDWEFAGPIDRLTEIAYAAWTCAQLYDDDLAEKNALPDAQTRMQLVRDLVDAYGLSTSQRKLLADRLIEVAIRGAAAEVIEQNISMESSSAKNPWAIAWRTRSAAWMLRNKLIIQHALQ